MNGHTFVALDSGEGAISASWTEPVLVNQEMTFTVNAPGAAEVRMYEGGYQEYSCTTVVNANGGSVIWTPEETGTYCVRFEALVNDQWLTTKNYALELRRDNVITDTEMSAFSEEVQCVIAHFCKEY